MRRWLVRILVAIPVILFLVLITAWLRMRTSLPDYEGEVALAGLSGPVEIIRDENAVPHIFAETERDAYFALGYAHAQDRLWQMEMNRHTAMGTLSEMLGEATVGTDRFIRTLGVPRAARWAYEALTEETKAGMQAYADGVNAYLATREGALPVEFTAVWHEPEPWQPVHSTGWLKMMAYDLSGNFFRELARVRLAERLDARQIEDFYPAHRDEVWPALPEPLDFLGIDSTAGSGKIDEPAEGEGSNNWAVAGARTESGLPLLANDPHLGLTVPPVWYMAHISIGGRNLAGFTLPGVPGIILGRNDHVAWGFTNTGPDTQDLYVEELNETGDAVRTPTGWQPLEIRQETIRVRDGPDVDLIIRETRHGPVLSDVMEDVRAALPENYALALRWTAMEAGDTTANVLANFARAETMAGLVDIASDYVTPQQNIVAADTAGNIGFLAPGRIPLRHADNAAQGRLPVPGWDEVYDWQGYIPADGLPLRLNPESGYVATANARIAGPDYPYLLSDSWASPYRTLRIEEMIEARDAHSRTTMQAMQMDITSAKARRYVPLMLAMANTVEPDVAAALSTWDGRMDPDRAEPLIWITWYMMLVREVMADELGPLYEDYEGLRSNFMDRVLTDTAGAARWCDDIATPARESCAEQMDEAYIAAMAALAGAHGANWTDWRWGDVHSVRHRHELFSNFPVLRDIFDITAPIGGGPWTVNVAGMRPGTADPFENRHGPSMRAVYDMAAPEQSLFIMPAGQSGNIFSPWYNHLTDDWLKGRYIRIPTARTMIEESAIGRLILVPETR